MISADTFKHLYKKRDDFQIHIEFHKIVFMAEVLDKIKNMGTMRF